MKSKIRISNRSIYRLKKRESFAVGSTCLVVEDRVHLLFPGRSERIMRIAGTGVYYSMVPLCPDSHRLLCYNYCDDALKLRDPDFYRRTLVLGCGGGAIPRWLLEEYPGVSVDVVDISPEMIRVCRKYFLDKWEGSSRLDYYCTDAHFFDMPDYKYQFIFCDLFGGTEPAPFVCDKSFAEKLRGMLCDEGILVINCGWGHMDEIEEAYREAFADLEFIERKPWQTEVVRMSRH